MYTIEHRHDREIRKRMVDRTRRLCGDVYLVGEPAIARISDLKVKTFVRKDEIKFESDLQDLPPDTQLTLRAQLLDNGRMVKEFSNQLF